MDSRALRIRAVTAPTRSIWRWCPSDWARLWLTAARVGTIVRAHATRWLGHSSASCSPFGCRGSGDPHTHMHSPREGRTWRQEGQRAAERMRGGGEEEEEGTVVLVLPLNDSANDGPEGAVPFGRARLTRATPGRRAEARRVSALGTVDARAAMDVADMLRTAELLRCNLSGKVGQQPLPRPLTRSSRCSISARPTRLVRTVARPPFSKPRNGTRAVFRS